MKRHIIYIINPVSMTGKNASLERYIEKMTKREKIPYQVFPSEANGDYSLLRTIIRDQKITDVVIAGGDGTVSQAVCGLMGCDINFGIIPCGSGNGLAFSAKISKKRARALQVIFNGKAAAIDGFFVNDHFACVICGLGFDARVAHDFARQPNRGLTTYAKVVMRNFFSMKTCRFELQWENGQLETDACFVSIANSNQFGNNFTIAPKASLSDGLLDIVIVPGKNKISFILQTLKQLAGWNKLMAGPPAKEKKGLIYFQTNKLIIKNLSHAPLHIDGDPAVTATELKIAVKNKCFRLLQPL